MVTQEIINYIQSTRQAGYSDDQILSELKANGWAEEDIQEAFTEFGSGQQTLPSSPLPPPGSKQVEQPTGIYPVIHIPYITNPNRLYAIPLLGGLIKIILLIPHAIVLYIFAILLMLCLPLNSLVVLFTGKYWHLAYTIVKNFMILYTKSFFFFSGLTNKYPGFNFFTLDDTYEMLIDYPVLPHRFFAIPFLGGLVRYILIFPFAIWFAVVNLAAQSGVIISSVPVLLSGKYPESTFELAVDSVRMYNSYIMYFAGLTDAYPSFSISWKHKIAKFMLLTIPVLIFFGSITLPIALIGVNPTKAFNQANQIYQQSQKNNSHNNSLIINEGEIAYADKDGVFILDTSTMTSQRISTRSAYAVIYSPDGQYLYYDAYDENNLSGDLYIKNLHTNQTKMKKSIGFVSAINLSQDGEYGLISSSIIQTNYLTLINKQGDTIKSITDGGEPEWSPQENKFLYSVADAQPLSGTTMRVGGNPDNHSIYLGSVQNQNFQSKILQKATENNDYYLLTNSWINNQTISDYANIVYPDIQTPDSDGSITLTANPKNTTKFFHMNILTGEISEIQASPSARLYQFPPSLSPDESKSPDKKWSIVAKAQKDNQGYQTFIVSKDGTQSYLLANNAVAAWKPQ